MINFILPGFYLNFNANKKILKLFIDYPEYFYDKVNLYAIYDSFPWNILSGGREPFTDGKHATIEEIQNILETFKQLEIRQICTNSLINETNLHNRFSNICLQLCEDTKNAIVINSDLLLKYLQQQYPKYKIILSTTACITNNQLLLEKINDNNYNMICLDYNMNHNFLLLDSLTQEQKNKCEFLVNPVCQPGCKERSLHYKQISKAFLDFFPHSARLHHCYKKDKFYCTDIQWNQSTVISPQEIFDIYEPKGFSYFKLEDRTLTENELINIYLTYLIQPQYKEKVLLYFTQMENN